MFRGIVNQYSVSDYTEGQHVCVKVNNACQSFSVKKPWALGKVVVGLGRNMFEQELLSAFSQACKIASVKFLGVSFFFFGLSVKGQL